MLGLIALSHTFSSFAQSFCIGHMFVEYFLNFLGQVPFITKVMFQVTVIEGTERVFVIGKGLELSLFQVGNATGTLTRILVCF